MTWSVWIHYEIDLKDLAGEFQMWCEKKREGNESNFFSRWKKNSEIAYFDMEGILRMKFRGRRGPVSVTALYNPFSIFNLDVLTKIKYPNSQAPL